MTRATKATTLALAALTAYAAIVAVGAYSGHWLAAGQAPAAFGDYELYDLAARRWLADPVRLYDRAEMLAYHGFIYPPPGVLAFVPFTLLGQAYGMVVGFTAFLAVSALSGVLAAWLLARWMGVRAGLMPPTALAILAASPFLMNLVAAQVNLILVCLCAGGLFAGQRGRPWLGGALLAAACWLKIYPAVLVLVMLALPGMRATGMRAVVVGVGLGSALLPVVPLALYKDYVFFALPTLSGQAVLQLDNQSMAASLMRAGLPIPDWFRSAVLPIPRGVRMVSGGIAVALTGGMVWRALGARLDPWRQRVVMLSALACVPLVSPQGWGHAYFFAVPLAVFLAVEGGWPMLRAAGVLAWLALLVPAYHVFGWVASAPDWFAWALYSRAAIAFTVLIGIAVVAPSPERGRVSPRGPRPAGNEAEAVFD